MKTKTIIKITFYCFLPIIATFIIWFGQGYFYDELPDAGRYLFYNSNIRHIPDQSNAAIAISGINAPINLDPILYGRTRIDAFNTAGKTNLKTPNEINFIGIDKQNEIHCNLQDAIEVVQRCTRLEHIEALIDSNKILLNRYTNLYKIKDWKDPVSGGSQTILDLNSLVSAQIKLLISQEKPEQAYQLWKENHAFISRMLLQETTITSLAIFLVTEGISLSSLENLIYAKPEIAVKHAEELKTILNSKNLDRYNLQAKLRAEFHFYDSNLSKEVFKNKNVHKEYIRNRIYRSHLEFLKAAKIPPSEMAAKLTKHKTFSLPDFLKLILPHGVSKIVADMIVSETNRGMHLLKSMYAKNTFNKLIGLRLLIQLEDVPRDNIHSFIEKSGNKYVCPLTRKPVAWDADKEIIYCEDINKKQRVAEVRLKF